MYKKLYPDTSLFRIISTLIKTRGRSYTRNNLFRTLHRMMKTLAWEKWTLGNKVTFFFTFIYVLYRLWSWNNNLTPRYLDELFLSANY